MKQNKLIKQLEKFFNSNTEQRKDQTLITWAKTEEGKYLKAKLIELGYFKNKGRRYPSKNDKVINNLKPFTKDLEKEKIKLEIKDREESKRLSEEEKNRLTREFFRDFK